MGSDFVGLVGILDVLVVFMATLMILLCCVDVVFHCVDDFALLCLCCSYVVVLMILLCCVCQIFLLNECLRVVLEKKECKRFINKVTDTIVL